MKYKLMFLACVGGYSGAENMTLMIAGELQKRGYETFYCSPDGPIKKYIIDDHPTVRFVGLKKFDFLNVITAYRRIKPDLLYAVDFKVTIICSLLGYPFVAHLHNDPIWLRKVGLKTLLLLNALNQSIGNICVSDSIMDEYIFSKYIKRPMKTILNVIDEEKVKKLAAQNDGEPYDVCFIGRICEQKDPLRFIEIIRSISKKIQSVSAIMIGDDGGLLEKCVEARGDLHINFIGFQKNPYQYVSQSKLVIMPSLWEGFGLTAVESMILGKPVLATRVGGLPAVIGDDELLCDTNDEFVLKAIRLLEQREYYNDKSAAVSMQARKFTNIENYVDEIQKVWLRDRS